MGLADELLAAKRQHYECEDCWYSCATICCDDQRHSDKCDCGADEHNALMERAAATLRASPSEADRVSVPKDIYEGALNYIRHVGSNWTMRGEPHPQQWIVDGLERCGRSSQQEEKP